MPYLDPERRRYVNTSMELFDGYPRLSPGDLNYIITRQVQDFLGAEPNYEKFNAAIGALESVKLELYRRMVAPYEDKKKEENGDVYE